MQFPDLSVFHSFLEWWIAAARRAHFNSMKIWLAGIQSVINSAHIMGITSNFTLGCSHINKVQFCPDRSHFSLCSFLLRLVWKFTHRRLIMSVKWVVFNIEFLKLNIDLRRRIRIRLYTSIIRVKSSYMNTSLRIT